jgi:hypothetical protein
LRPNRIRRVLIAAGVAATAIVPLSLSGAAPASASCGPQLAEEGGNGCSNPCNEGLEKLARRLGQELHCIQ